MLKLKRDLFVYWYIFGFGFGFFHENLATPFKMGSEIVQNEVQVQMFALS